MKKSAFLIMFMLANSVLATERFYSKIYLGASVLGNQEFSQSNFKPLGVKGEMETNLGYRAGFSIGWIWHNNFSSEITFDYVTNNAKTSFTDGSKFNGGDYSSRLHFINTYYHFNSTNNFRPYVGLGIGMVEEIDIDLEDSNGEQSFSDNGDIGYQIIIGTDFKISEIWKLSCELANMSFAGPEFKQEGGSAIIFDDEGYEVWNLNIALKYEF